jgi:hypothetical protein
MSELTAYHEAGHAVVAQMLGGIVSRITIEPENDDGPERFGDTQVLWRRSQLTDTAHPKRLVEVCLAGPVAEMIYSGNPYHPGLVAEWAVDWREAWIAAIPLHAKEEPRLKFLEQTSIQLYHRVKRDEIWAVLASVADNLLAHATLDQDQFADVVRGRLG